MQTHILAGRQTRERHKSPSLPCSMWKCLSPPQSLQFWYKDWAARRARTTNFYHLSTPPYFDRRANRCYSHSRVLWNIYITTMLFVSLGEESVQMLLLIMRDEFYLWTFTGWCPVGGKSSSFWRFMEKSGHGNWAKRARRRLYLHQGSCIKTLWRTDFRETFYSVYCNGRICCSQKDSPWIKHQSFRAVDFSFVNTNHTYISILGNRVLRYYYTQTSEHHGDQNGLSPMRGSQSPWGQAEGYRAGVRVGADV